MAHSHSTRSLLVQCNHPAQPPIMQIKLIKQQRCERVFHVLLPSVIVSPQKSREFSFLTIASLATHIGIDIKLIRVYLLPPPDFLISPCARRTRRSPFSTRRKLRRGWPTAKRRRQPLPRRRECSPCVKYRAHGEHIRRVLFVAHGEIKVTNGVGRSLRRRGQLRRVLAV